MTPTEEFNRGTKLTEIPDDCFEDQPNDYTLAPKLPRNGQEYYQNRINLRGCSHLKKMINQTIGRMPVLTYNANASTYNAGLPTKGNNYDRQRQGLFHNTSKQDKSSKLTSQMHHNVSTFGTIYSTNMDKIPSRLSPINLGSQETIK